MKHQQVHYIRNYHDFTPDRQREILQALACSAESLSNSLSCDPDAEIRLHYGPLIQKVDRDLREAFDELSK